MKEKLESYLKESEEIYCTRTDRDIEQNRKGSFELILTDTHGKPLENCTVTAEMTALDFNFGCNIFMLGEYDSPEKNRLYEEKFTALFNTATLPLYWEGTESEEVYLRYQKGTPHDIYRRPPLEETIEFCEKNHLRMKGHPLFWHEFVPDWLPDRYADLKPHIVRRFAEIAEVCRSRVESFDVVNEPSRIYDVHVRDRGKGRKHLVPDDNYCEELFDLAKRYFPASKLILNDVTDAVFSEFRGKYSGFYLLLEKYLNKGVPIDEIGFQCHIADGTPNAYNTERLYDILDTYATLGRPINISEISIGSSFGGIEDEDFQAVLVERLYKTCFSHKAVSGITWWNLPDDGILTTKRVAAGENLPSTGLLAGDYHEKAAYKILKKLITEDWKTHVTIPVTNGIVKFRGFYGDYKLTVTQDEKQYESNIRLFSDMSNIRTVKIK